MFLSSDELKKLMEDDTQRRGLEDLIKFIECMVEAGWDRDEALRFIAIFMAEMQKENTC